MCGITKRIGIQTPPKWWGLLWSWIIEARRRPASGLPHDIVVIIVGLKLTTYFGVGVACLSRIRGANAGLRNVDN